MAIYVILTIVAIVIGMVISITTFGTGGKRARIFKDIYFSIEDVDGIGVLYTKTGEYSAILAMENPVQKFCADIDSYYSFTALRKVREDEPRPLEYVTVGILDEYVPDSLTLKADSLLNDTITKAGTTQPDSTTNNNTAP